MLSSLSLIVFIRDRSCRDKWNFGFIVSQKERERERERESVCVCNDFLCFVFFVVLDIGFSILNKLISKIAKSIPLTSITNYITVIRSSVVNT